LQHNPKQNIKKTPPTPLQGGNLVCTSVWKQILREKQSTSPLEGGIKGCVRIFIVQYVIYELNKTMLKNKILIDSTIFLLNLLLPLNHGRIADFGRHWIKNVV